MASEIEDLNPETDLPPLDGDSFGDPGGRPKRPRRRHVGTIYREADGKTPNGLMDENAHIAMLMKTLPKFTTEQSIGMLGAAQDIYIQNGFTTVQDGRSDPGALSVLPLAAEAGAFKIDVVAYPDLVLNEKSPALTGPLMSRHYTDHFRIGGVKLGFDGSPQGKTAWFTKPYFKVLETIKEGRSIYTSPGR